MVWSSQVTAGRCGSASASAVMARLNEMTANGEFLQALDERARAEPTPAAHGHDAVAATGALELVQRLGEKYRAGAAQRVAEGDGTAIGIDLLHVDAELLAPCQHDRGEGLV